MTTARERAEALFQQFGDTGFSGDAGAVGYNEFIEAVNVIRKDGMCATCADEKPEPAPQWKAFHAMAWPKLWGIETTDPRAAQAGLEILVAPCMPEHAAKALANAYNFAVFTQNLQLSCVRGDS